MSKADRIITASPTWALWTICVEPGRGHLLPTALLARSSARQRSAINLYSAKKFCRNAQDYFIEMVFIPRVLHGALLLVKGNRKLPHLWDLFSTQILQIAVIISMPCAGGNVHQKMWPFSRGVCATGCCYIPQDQQQSVGEGALWGWTEEKIIRSTLNFLISDESKKCLKEKSLHWIFLIIRRKH